MRHSRASRQTCHSRQQRLRSQRRKSMTHIPLLIPMPRALCPSSLSRRAGSPLGESALHRQSLVTQVLPFQMLSSSSNQNKMLVLSLVISFHGCNHCMLDINCSLAHVKEIKVISCILPQAGQSIPPYKMQCALTSLSQHLITCMLPRWHV